MEETMIVNKISISINALQPLIAKYLKIINTVYET